VTHQTTHSGCVTVMCGACINTYMKFEVHSSTDSKDMIGAKFKKNWSRDPDNAHYVAVCYQKPAT